MRCFGFSNLWCKIIWNELTLIDMQESRLNLSQRSSPQVTRTTVSRTEESSSSTSRSGVKRRRLSDGDGSSIGGGVRYTHYKAKVMIRRSCNG